MALRLKQPRMIDSSAALPGVDLVRQEDARAGSAARFERAVRLGGSAEGIALADLHIEDAAAERIEQAVSDRAHLARRAGVMAEVWPADPRGLADEGGDVGWLDRAGGLAIADEMA